MLISPGAESHVFEPTPRDIVAMNNADLLIYVGGHGDEWVDALLNSSVQNLRTAALFDMVDTVMTEHIHHEEPAPVTHGHTCSSHGHSHAYEEEECDEDCDEHEPHEDEHVWTCPRNAIVIVRALTEILCEMDAANAEYFRANAGQFILELTALDLAFGAVVSDAARNTVVFADRFPFRYLTDTLGLTYHAAFYGCSADTQVSPGTIAFLINTVNNENIPVIFAIEFSDLLIANTVAEATGARILEMHSAHNVSAADFNAGITYLEIMYRNVEALREALS
jgi:zinc transport system substrate-binding protein